MKGTCDGSVGVHRLLHDSMAVRPRQIMQRFSAIIALHAAPGCWAHCAQHRLGRAFPATATTLRGQKVPDGLAVRLRRMLDLCMQLLYNGTRPRLTVFIEGCSCELGAAAFVARVGGLGLRTLEVHSLWGGVVRRQDRPMTGH
jgi:hypothetical protein